MSTLRSFITRLSMLTVTLAVVCASLLPGFSAQAFAEEQQMTLFRANFNAAPIGPVSSPLKTEVGTVVPRVESMSGAVAVAAVQGDKALVLDSTTGPATALLRWRNFPNDLTSVSNGEARNLRIKADVITNGTASTNAAFGLLNSDTFFEFFSIAANGQITRDGAPVGLTCAPGTRIQLDGRIRLGAQDGSTSGNVQIRLRCAGQSTTINVDLPAAFALNQLRMQVTAGIAAIDNVMVHVEGQKQDDTEPEPVINVGDSDVEHDIEHVNGVTFVNINITIANTGGDARGVFLVIDRATFEQLFDLADVSFLENVGFVSSVDGNQVIIGLGQNNKIRHNGKIKVKIKFKVKPVSVVNVTFNASFKLLYGGTGGTQEVALAPIVIVVPLNTDGTTPTTPTQPITSTNSLTPTTSMTPTVVVVRLPLERIDTRFKTYWNGRGGLAIFGFPITQPVTETNGIIVQYFERARLEYHPELAGTPYQVQLGLLAVELGYRQPPIAQAPTNPTDSAWYFAGTGHLIAAPFRSYWSNRGGLAIFGLPIGELVVENGHQVQYFERARLELHPELSGTPYQVQLGLLGVASLETNAR
jgi:hypothetical protein